MPINWRAIRMQSCSALSECNPRVHIVVHAVTAVVQGKRAAQVRLPNAMPLCAWLISIGDPYGVEYVVAVGDGPVVAAHNQCVDCNGAMAHEWLAMTWWK